MGVASRFEEAFFPKDARVLRQGLTGSGFYVILDGEADVVADGQKRATLARGDFFGEVSVLLGEPPTADIVATRPLRVHRPRRARRSRRSWSTTRGSCSGCSRRRRAGCATRTAPDRGRVAGRGAGTWRRAARTGRRHRTTSGRSRRASTRSSIVGSGPGALQVSYFLGRLGIEHALISADAGPGGMFRRWPFFQRLLSWTKPYALDDHASREFERWDWNSLLAREPELRGISAEFMDGTSDFPSRPEMEANLHGLRRARRRGGPLRLPLGVDAREETPDGDRFVLTTTDGEYRCRFAIFAVGVAEPYSPSTPGIELAVHYADTRDAESYAGKRLFIIGKQNSGFELATGPAPVGEPDLAVVAVAGQDVDRDALARRRPGALRPAVRGLDPRRRRRHPVGRA